MEALRVLWSLSWTHSTAQADLGFKGPQASGEKKQVEDKERKGRPTALLPKKFKISRRPVKTRL